MGNLDFDEFIKSLEDASYDDYDEDYDLDDNSYEDEIDREAYEAAIGMNPYKEDPNKSKEYIKLGMSEKFLKESDTGVVTDDEIQEYASIIYPEKVVLRSLILDIFTPEMLFEFERISRSLEVSNNKKVELIMKRLDMWNIDYHPLNPGTNRLGIMTQGYVVKIAIDSDGKIDNQREFIYSMTVHNIGTVKCYETSPNGICAVFRYGEVFTIDDYFKNQAKMREILADLTGCGFLVGDVGISSDNYLNWAYLDDGEIGIIDYAYIYSVKFRTFSCSCNPGSLLCYDKDFVMLVCPHCGKKYSFKDIRKRISRADQQKEIGDVMQKGYVISSSEEEVKFNPKFTEDAEQRIRKALLKLQKKRDKRVSYKKHNSFGDEEMTPEELIDAIENRKFKEE